MFAYKWKDIITSICAVKPECVDKEKIIYNLENRYDYDDKILDELYELKVINVEEYIKYIKLLIEKNIEKNDNFLSCCGNKIEIAEELKESFSPTIYYCNAYIGGISENL